MPENDIVENELNLAETLSGLMRMLIQGRWIIMIAFVVVTLTGVGIIMRLPDEYSSEAILVADQLKVSERYVEPLSMPGAGAGASEELASLTREVMSRVRLLEVIESFGLYPAKRGRLTPDELVTLLRKDVTVEPLGLASRKDLGAFRISFKAGTPQVARDVTNRLTSLFIEAEIQNQEGKTNATTKFLTEQLALAKRRLEEQEQRLRDFKSSAAGTLPEQQQGNVTALIDLRNQLQDITASKNRAQQQKNTIEFNLKSHIAKLEGEKATLLKTFTQLHPEVQNKEKVIQRAQATLNRLRSGQATLDIGVTDDPVLANLEGQVEAALTEMAEAPKDEQRVRREIAQYQGRLSLTPLREQELASLVRDYETYKKDYSDLLDRQLRSLQAASLEEKHGQRFRLIDPPTLPTIPTSPKRVKLAMGAAGGGLVLGLGLVVLVSLFDSTYNSEKQIRKEFGPPFVVGIPVLLTPSEEKKRKRNFGIEMAVATILLCVVGAVEFYVYRNG